MSHLCVTLPIHPTHTTQLLYTPPIHPTYTPQLYTPPILTCRHFCSNLEEVEFVQHNSGGFLRCRRRRGGPPTCIVERSSVPLVRTRDRGLHQGA